MSLDLFGNPAAEKHLTSTQRMTARQAALPGRDLYTTDPHDVGRFLDALRADGLRLPSPVWEPAAGRGDISKTLMKHGYDVFSTDIFPYADGEINVTEMDFFRCGHHRGSKTIFTNPPFNRQEEFLSHALSMGVDVVFFVRLSFLSSRRRHVIFRKYPPAYVYVYSGRAVCYKDGDPEKGQNMVDYCVVMWKPPYGGDTKLRWIE